MVRSWRPSAIALAAACSAAALPFPAAAQSAAELETLRNEIRTLRADYEQRLQRLERQLQAAEAARAAPAAAAATPAAPAPLPAPATAAATSEPAAAGPGVATAGARPPLDVSLILSGQLVRRTLADRPGADRLRGVLQPGDAEGGPPARGFRLGESELGFSANVDPFFRARANISFGAEKDVAVEEAFVETTQLGQGLTLRAGRFLSAIGYLNGQHPHTWDFADAPLAYEALFGGRFATDGVQVAWVAPTDRFVEVRGELGRGLSFPSATQGNRPSMAALAVHAGDDIGDSLSWRAGLSLLQARAEDQPLAGGTPGSDFRGTFTGRTRAWIADGVWKWAPQGNPTRTNFKLQGEVLRATRSGDLLADTDSAAAARLAPLSGWYLQALYQFMPRWRVGLRGERLDAGNALGVTERSSRTTLALEHNPSEFSRIRLQLARDGSRVGGNDWVTWLQYQMSLGAHGAHSF